MFDNLSERLERSFKILKGEGKITEINVAETLKDVRRALLDADVNYKVAKTFTDTVKQKALGQNVLTAVKPSQLMVKIVHDELATLMGGETAELNLQGHPSVILMAGLNGAGKTTLSGKLALMLKTKKRKNPLLAACDIYRPAAIEQLKVLGEQIGIPVYSEPDNKDAVQIAQNAVKEAKAKGYDVVIVDTAGRLAVDEQMMQEIAAIKHGINPRRDTLRGRCHDRTGCREHGQGIQRPSGLRRRGAHQIGRRHPRRCGLVYPYGGEQAHQIRRHGRENGSHRPVPSFAYGRPYLWVWETSCRSWKGSGTIRRGRSTPPAKRKSPRTSSTSTISCRKSSKSRRWVT